MDLTIEQVLENNNTENDICIVCCGKAQLERCMDILYDNGYVWHKEDEEEPSDLWNRFEYKNGDLVLTPIFITNDKTIMYFSTLENSIDAEPVEYLFQRHCHILKPYLMFEKEIIECGGGD